MSVYSDLQAQKPAAGAGRPLGYEDWRWVVEIALPISDTAVLGTFVLGTDVLSNLTYADLTDRVEETGWTRGGGTRPETGELTFRIQDPTGEYAPYQSRYFGPGTLCRVGVGRGDTGLNGNLMIDYYPQFTGLVQAWEEGDDAFGKVGWVDVTVWEVTYLLGRVDNPALDVAVGEGDTVADRAQRLLDAARAKFGLVVDLHLNYAFTLQATDMADDPLTELYQVADTADALLYSTKGGDIAITSRALRAVDEAQALFTTSPRIVYEGWYDEDVTMVADSLKTLNDDLLLVADTTVGRIGDVPVTYTQDGVAGRYGYRADSDRTDLWTSDLYANADLEWVATRVLARGGKHPYRPASLHLSSLQTDATNVVPFLIVADVGQLVDLLRNSRVLFEGYAITRLSHRVTPLSSGALEWTCDVTLGVEAESGWTDLAPFLLTDEGDFLLTDDGDRITV